MAAPPRSRSLAILSQISAFLARRRLITGLRDARRAQRGLHVADWTLPEEQLFAQLVNWSRDVLAGCRRPHGIAHFDLTVTLSSGDRTDRFYWKRLDPADLWRDDGPLAQLRTHRPAMTGEIAMTAALFSWGEATHYALTQLA
jgi:hypothetical protein